jgi:hypothetical protein
MTAAEAFATLADLDMVEWDVVDTPVGEYVVTGFDRLVELFDTDAGDEVIDAEHGDELAELTELDRREVLEWITIVRLIVLKQHADALNQAAASVGAHDDYVVGDGRVVSGRMHAELAREQAVASRRNRLAVIVRPVVRARPRARGRRSRTTARRSPARSPGRQEPEPPPRPVEAIA